MTECDFCDMLKEKKKDQLDPFDKRRWIIDKNGWFAILARDYLTRGHTLLILSDEEKHRKDITDLDDDSGTKVFLGTLVKLSKAVKEAMGCEKVHIGSFCEKGVTEHMHFHLVPRYEDSPKGYEIFCQRQNRLDDMSPQEIKRLAAKIRNAFNSLYPQVENT